MNGNATAAMLEEGRPSVWRSKRGFALLSSVFIHLGAATLLNRPIEPPPPPLATPLTRITLAPQKPEPEPPRPKPPKAESPKPSAPTRSPKQSKAQTSKPASRTKSSDSTPPSTNPIPIVLSGFSFSNAGVGMAVSVGGGGESVTSPARPAPTPARKVKKAPTKAPPAVTPLKELSAKPTPPALDDKLRKNYPGALRARGVEGQAMVRLVVSSGGRVQTASIISESAPGFGAACKKTVLGSQWTAPKNRLGQPVRTALSYRCRFRVGL